MHAIRDTYIYIRDGYLLRRYVQCAVRRCGAVGAVGAVRCGRCAMYVIDSVKQAYWMHSVCL